MATLPLCSKDIINHFEAALQPLADHWAAPGSDRPQLDPGVAAQWDALIREWSQAVDIPLFLRKKPTGHERGEVYSHQTGRELVWADNSIAGWAFAYAYSGDCPTLDEVRAMLAADTIPVAMVVTGAMKKRSRYIQCRVKRGGLADPNTQGWKVCHIAPLAMNGNTPLTDRPLAELQRHFVDFLSPSNMFLVPKQLAGIGEAGVVLEAIRRVNAAGADRSLS